MSIIRYQSPEISAWTPYERLSTLRDEMNRLFEGTASKSARDSGLFGGWSPALDVHQDRDSIYVTVELPGLKKEEIEITIHDGALSVAGERKSEAKAGDGESYRSERYFGRFHRSVSLPAAVDSSKVTAVYKDGILSITLPKSEEAKPKQIEVNVS